MTKPEGEVMKFILVLILAALLSGCGASVPTAVVTVTAVPQAEMLSDDEQEVFDFIALHYAGLDDSWSEANEAVEDGDLSYGKTLRALNDATDQFTPVYRQWSKLDYANGNVDDLERVFTVYAESMRKFYLNWLKGMTGSNISACANAAYNAEQRIEKYGPRVQKELAALLGLSSY